MREAWEPGSSSTEMISRGVQRQLEAGVRLWGVESGDWVMMA
jgi:hypothetical protein